MNDFDYPTLKLLLHTATSKAINYVLQLTEHEHLYAFALYTSGEVAYIVPTANTEEALTRKAEQYAARHSGEIDLHRLSLRWSPCDWEYHLRGEEVFTEINNLLDAAYDEEAGESAYDSDKIEDICISVLSEIKQQIEGAEESNLNGIIFNLLRGDQSDEERVEFAKRLNAKDEVAKFQRELNRNAEAWYTTH